jgi:hypothetical protein
MKMSGKETNKGKVKKLIEQDKQQEKKYGIKRSAK